MERECCSLGQGPMQSKSNTMLKNWTYDSPVTYQLAEPNRNQFAASVVRL